MVHMMFDDIIKQSDELSKEEYRNLYCAICTTYDECQGHKYYEECQKPKKNN